MGCCCTKLHLLHSSYTDPLVKFEVGPSKVLFHVHRGIITRQSKVLAAAFHTKKDGTEGFKEATELTMNLPEEDPDNFRLFVHWVYTGRCSSVTGMSQEEAEESTLGERLVKLYVFGDKYDIPKLRVVVFKELIEVMSKGRLPSFEVPFCAYRLTTTESPLRKLCAVAYGSAFGPTWLARGHLATISKCPEFTVDFLGVVGNRVTDWSRNVRRAGLESLVSSVAPEKDKPDTKS